MVPVVRPTQRTLGMLTRKASARVRLFPVINLFLNDTQTSGNYGFKETDLDSS